MKLPSQLGLYESQMLKVIKNSFKETVDTTRDYLSTDEARDYFFKQSRGMRDFYRNSGIEKEWNSIIEKHASKGADITTEIYNYARNKGINDTLVPWTSSEKVALNKLCDYNYELIKNVTSDQIRGIRQSLIEDYAAGVNPRRTSIKEKLEQIQLEPINGLSPEKRAEMIARTETMRINNTAQLEQMRAAGVEYVSLLCSSPDCEECMQYADTLVPITEALEEPCIHPNCRCSWKAEINPETGTYQNPNIELENNNDK